VSVAHDDAIDAKPPPSALLRLPGKLLHMDRDQALVTWERLVLVIWRGECHSIAVRRLEQAGIEALRQHPRGVALMGVVEATASPPSSEMRKASALTNDRLAQLGLVGIAGVLSHSGFAGSVMRGVITGLTLLQQVKYPFKVFENHTDGAAWLCKCLAANKAPMGALECANVVGQYRSTYGEHWKHHFAATPG
jgi:hypothetical protein